MSIFNALFGTASEIDPEKLEKEFTPILVDGEQVTGAFKLVRDLIVFTQYRLILADKQGATGSKVEYHSVPYKSITQFTVETAGFFDADSEMTIYVSGNPNPIHKEFRGRTDVVEIQKMLARYMFTK